MIPVRPAGLEDVRVVRGDARTVVRSVVVDSRLVRTGSLFVALPGSRVDGHAFAHDAERRGAVAVLRRAGRDVRTNGCAVFETEHPPTALPRLASLVRSRSQARVVGVAGAVGKTSTKDILRALCAPHVPTIASPLSFNNELGVPLTLCLLDDETEIAVCELGTGAPGELRALCNLARPALGVLTAVGPEHLESFGTVAAAVREEAALIRTLRPGSTLVLPAAEPRLAPHRRADLAELTFGLDCRADVRVLRWRPTASETSVVLDVAGVRVAFQTNLRAPHHRLNLSAAVATYAALGLPLSRVGAGAALIRLSPLRGQERSRRSGGLVINDSYNANPLSLEAAVAALVHRAAGARTVAVLGEMAELGPRAAAWHRRAGRRVADAGVDKLVGVGPLAREYCLGAGDRVATCWFADASTAARQLPALLGPGDVVLLKASRAAALERLEDAVS